MQLRRLRVSCCVVLVLASQPAMGASEAGFAGTALKKDVISTGMNGRTELWDSRCSLA